jgi:hypothetical protein
MPEIDKIRILHRHSIGEFSHRHRRRPTESTTAKRV